MDPLLRRIAETCPHISPQLARDWLERAREIAEATVLRRPDKPASSAAFQEAIQRDLRFHIRMLSGFGASDMAVLYTAYTGGHHPFATAADIVRRKLCIDAPTVPTGDLARGIAHEPHARALAHSKLSDLNLQPDHEARDKLRAWLENGGDSDHPWLKAFPDDILVSASGIRYVLEYKSPYEHSSVEEMSICPPDAHCVQLEQAKMCLERAGVTVDRLILVPFSTKTWDVYPAEVASSLNRQQTILEAGDYYWGHVERAQIPEFNPTKSYEAVSELPGPAKASMGRLLLARKLKRMTESMEADARDSFYGHLRAAGVDLDRCDHKISLPCFNITRTQQKGRLDTKMLQQRFVELGGDIDDPTLYKEATEVVRLDTVRSKTSQYMPLIEQVDELAQRSLDLAAMDLAEILEIDTLTPVVTTEPADVDKRRDDISLVPN